MNEELEIYAIKEIADNLKTDYNTIKNKIKRYKFKAITKMYNGRLCKAVYMTIEQYQAIEHELEYNRQKKVTQKLHNDQIFPPNEGVINTDIIDLQPLGSEKKDVEKYIQVLKEGYLLALEEKEKRIQDKDKLIDRLEKDLAEKNEQILSLKTAQNEQENKQGSLLKKLLNKIKFML